MSRQGRRPGRFERAIWHTFDRRCWLCGRVILGRDLTLDHVLPKSLGGSRSVRNLYPAHRACNERRGNLTGAGLQSLVATLRAT